MTKQDIEQFLERQKNWQNDEIFIGCTIQDMIRFHYALEALISNSGNDFEGDDTT